MSTGTTVSMLEAWVLIINIPVAVSQLEIITIVIVNNWL